MSLLLALNEIFHIDISLDYFCPPYPGIFAGMFQISWSYFFLEYTKYPFFQILLWVWEVKVLETPFGVRGR